jgi:hypothetical protein
MANKDAPFGFRPAGKVGQNADNGGLSERLISASATAIFQNDLVKLKSDGSIEVAETNVAVVGSLNGVFFTDASTSKPTFANHLKASNTATDIKGFVYDDPYQRFECQSDNTGASALTDINNNSNITYLAGATPNFISKSEFKDGDLAAGAATLRHLGFSKDPDNSDVGSANVNIIVSINEHQDGKAVDGI